MRLSQAVPQDDLWLLAPAESLYADGEAKLLQKDGTYGDHPYLYLYALVWSFHLFGVGPESARIIGIVSGLITIVMIYGVIRSCPYGSVIERQTTAAAAAVLYALCPAVIQSSAVIHIDNTVLIPLILLFVWSAEKFLYGRARKSVWAGMMILSLCLALWARISTPVLLALLTAVYFLFHKRFSGILLILSGMFLFFITWFGFSRIMHTPFIEPILYTFSSAMEKGAEFDWGRYFQGIFYLTYWTGVFPVFILMIVVAKTAVSKIKNQTGLADEDLFLFTGGALFFGYYVIGGIKFGFPRYHMPTFPLLYAACALFTLKQNHMKAKLPPLIICVLLLGSFAAQIYATGDLLYTLRYTLRQAMAYAEPVSGITEKLLIRIGLFSLISLAMFLFCAKRYTLRITVSALLFLSMGTSAGIIWLQSSAPYHTGFNYGEVGAFETAMFIKQRIRNGESVVAPMPIIYYMKRPNLVWMSDSDWSDTAKLMQLLRDRQVFSLSYSITANTVQQIRILSNNPDIEALLRSDFSTHKIGTYTTWLRNRVPGLEAKLWRKPT